MGMALVRLRDAAVLEVNAALLALLGHDRSSLRRAGCEAIVPGAWLDEGTGERFLANPPADPAVLWDLQNRESLGRPGTVSQVEGRNVFVPAA